MKTLSEVESELTRLNKHSATLFPSIKDDLSHVLNESSLLEWSNICFEIADAGWHAWETANLYMQLSHRLLPVLGQEAVLSVGRYGLGLCGRSFEPCNQYFLGINGCLDEISQDSLQTVEGTGNIIIDRFHTASNLIADYFKSAFFIIGKQDIDSLTNWMSIVEYLVTLDRHEILDFLKVSRQNPDVNWLYAKRLYLESIPNGRDYIVAHGQLMSRLVGVEIDFEDVIIEFTRKKLAISEWLGLLTERAPQLSATEFKSLIRLLKEVPHSELLEAFIDTSRELPLENRAVMLLWLKAAMEMAPLNFQASMAFIRLESAKSVDLLEALRGQVRFADEQRTLQLYCEALIGKRLRVESNDSEDEEFRGLPSSDGESVYLPEIVGSYMKRVDNFRWLKVALSHQLGCYEFGTFDFNFKDSYIAFADYFRTYEEPRLAAELFRILEGGRIDWRVQQCYKGVGLDIETQKGDALSGRTVPEIEPRLILLEALLQYSLDATDFEFVPSELHDSLSDLIACINPLKESGTTVFDTIDALADCYQIVSEFSVKSEFASSEDTTVDYRGNTALDKVRMNLQLMTLEDAEVEFSEDQDEEGLLITGMTASEDMKIDELQSGDVDDAMAIIAKDHDIEAPEDIEHVDEPGGRREFEELKKEKLKPLPETAFKYDEWDHNIDDYRKRWCTLYEIRELEEDIDFVPGTLSQHRGLANQVRRQLNMLRPELLRKVKGMMDGEELDLERSVGAIVDRKSGISPDENIYVQRQRKDRDVSALFLLDMSASTDDTIPDSGGEVASTHEFENDDSIHGLFEAGQADSDTTKRIIDVEKESVVLMAEALQGLGDNYAVCGFSGYGKDRVEYFICKDFEETYNHRAKGRIGGIKPCRSTRMGPAIRHATRMLAATESRIKALIIISDGYPQDFDYGSDRNSKDYGIKDTTKALTEANQQGVQSFCLTVDPSGHDYLREMCPDQQYMVMQDIKQLPSELSKIYRGLTT